MIGTRLLVLSFVLALGAMACGSDNSSPAGVGGSDAGQGGAGVGGGSASGGAGGSAGVGGATSGTGGAAGQVDGGAGGAAGGTVDGSTLNDAADGASTSPDASPGTDATLGADALPDAGNDGSSADAVSSVCNTIDNGAPEIVEQWATGTLPIPTGGTIQNGTYYVTTAELYETGEDAGYNGDVKRQTIVITGAGTATIHVEIVGYDNDRVVERSSGTLEYVTVDGALPTAIKLVGSCPTVATRQVGFTVAGNELYLLMNAGGEKTRLRLTRQ